MKNIKTLKIGWLKLGVMALTAPLVLASCLKDVGPVQDFSKSPALISFQFNGGSAIPFTASLLGTSSDSISLEVTLSVASLTLSTPVTGTIAEDDASLSAYNSDNGTSYTPLPTSQYTLQNNGQVTISPGQQIVTFSVHFAGDQIDFSQDNALALKITDASGATIATNLSTAIIFLKLRSIYEGNYTEDGVLTRFNGATEASGVLDQFAISTDAGTTPFSTISATTIEGQVVIPGFVAVYARFTVNSDNSVTISQSPITPYSGMQNTPGKQSTYDPNTGIFDLHGQFLNSAGNLREFDYTMSAQ